MGRIDCLFLHVPKLLNYYRPLHRFSWINLVPMGLFALADFLQRKGISTQIVHMGVERAENRDFSILSYLKEKTPRMVALDLHWHHQSFDVMETAKAIKATFPEVYVLLGGLTASFFHEEILKNFSTVDGIIRGEAETPMVELAQAVLLGKEDFFSIPNLTWRRMDRILVNPLSYVASEKELNDLSFTNFSLLENFDTYLHNVGQPFCGKAAPKNKNWIYSLRPPPYHLPVGRGCPVQCTWCGGGIQHQETMSGRKEVIFRGVENVLQSIKDAISYGYKTLHISFDPYPHRPEYYLRLFSRIRAEKLSMDCYFESFGLPTIDFIKAFKETFPGRGSLISLSPDVGSERLRRLHKGYPYSNRALVENLQQMEEHQVRCDLFFTLGVPFETEEDLQQTIRFQKKIRQRFRNVRAIHMFTIEMEPNSPWYLDPDAYGVQTSLQSFMDFYHYHSEAKNPFASLGYWIPGYFPDAEDEKAFEEALQKIKCRHACFVRPPSRISLGSFWGRRLCDLSHLAWRVKNGVGRKG
jgi:radical SAM superfamily enzyme YgiQ (UPF0313 family)